MKKSDFWKVCAALDNPKRLELLRLLIETDDFPCVVEIAERLELCAAAGSEYLRKLREAGLVTSKCENRRVYYRAFPSTEVGACVVDSFRRFFAANPSRSRIDDLLVVIRALAHPRRNAYLRFLVNQCDASPEEATARLEIPPTTLDRLFDQLGHARLVDANGHVSRTGREPEDTLLMQTLA